MRRRKLIIFSTFIIILFVVSILLLVVSDQLVYITPLTAQPPSNLQVANWPTRDASHSIPFCEEHQNRRGRKSGRAFFVYFERLFLQMVHFTGKTDLGTVVTNGHVHGYPDKDLNAYGSRILISGMENGTRLALQPGSCQLKMADNFQVKLMKIQ